MRAPGPPSPRGLDQLRSESYDLFQAGGTEAVHPVQVRLATPSLAACRCRLGRGWSGRRRPVRIRAATRRGRRRAPVPAVRGRAPQASSLASGWQPGKDSDLWPRSVFGPVLSVLGRCAEPDGPPNRAAAAAACVAYSHIRAMIRARLGSPSLARKTGRRGGRGPVSRRGRATGAAAAAEGTLPSRSAASPPRPPPPRVVKRCAAARRAPLAARPRRRRRRRGQGLALSGEAGAGPASIEK